MKTLVRNFRWIVLATAIATYALVIVGGIVRVSGSGLGCPDWPLCQGHVIPQLQGATLIEFSHRVTTTLVTILLLSSALLAWRGYRQDKWIFRPALLAVALLVLQIVLGGITVLLELPPAIVGIHLGNALILFACVITAAMFAWHPWTPRVGIRDIRPPSGAHDPMPRLALASAVGTFILILSGTVVTGTTAGYSCTTWPLCGEQLIPTGGILPIIAIVHRYIAGAIGLFILGTLVYTWRARRNNRALMTSSILAGVLFVFQVAVGAINVFLAYPVATGILHLASAAAVWASMVVFTIVAYQTSETAHAGHESKSAAPDKPQASTGQEAASQRSFATSMSPTAVALTAAANANGSATVRLVGNFFILTKPLIVALLLSTTLGAMLVAARGFPPLNLLFFTLLGGALTAGGSSALNSYIDRDIDPEMGRTSQRPIPLGKITPRQALIFGLTACATGVLVLLVMVNWLAALLSFAGILYYVGFYTIILKRTTPQNIVIGGLAGAIPPLVGWAAVTGQLNLLAIYLCLIIFYWTPPHTWSLMLMVTKDYSRVRVPMLPVARGEPETRRQIVLYSFLLVAITLIPFSLQDLGGVYLLAALVLGGRFLFLAFKLLRDQSKATARRLYMYSNAYLALLFLAMVLDQSIVHFFI
jgi:protoheme IX farnesyltransferase